MSQSYDEPNTSITLNDRMVDVIVRKRRIDPNVERAFRRTLRHYFLPGVDLENAYVDDLVVTAWSADGTEATSSSSQPSLMALMLQELDVLPGHRVLEIGTGTGYNAALLAALTEVPTNVHSVEISPEYSEQASSNLKANGTTGVNLVVADGWHGCPYGAPYDRIIVTAGCYDIAPAWFDQLKDGGRIVLPWGDRAMAFVKNGKYLEMLSHTFCGFMRMRGEYDLQVTEPSATGKDSPDSKLIEVPLEISPTDTPILREDLAFFLSLYLWPRHALISRLGNNLDIKFVVDTQEEIRRVILVRNENGWKIEGAAGDDLVPQAAEFVRQWFDAGTPGPEQLRMTATKRMSNLTNAKPTSSIARKWFSYDVSWAQSKQA